ncbi:unnamed protein product [Lepidochelys olivacea]
MLIKPGRISAPPFPIWAVRHREERKAKAKQRGKPASSLLAAKLHIRDPGAASELGLPRPGTGAASLAANHRLSGQSNRRQVSRRRRSWRRCPRHTHSCRVRKLSQSGGGTLAGVCTHGLNALELLRLKNGAERLGPMTEGLAACFSRAMEVVQKRPVEPWTNIRLVLQSDGKWLELRAGQIKQTLLVCAMAK